MGVGGSGRAKSTSPILGDLVFCNGVRYLPLHQVLCCLEKAVLRMKANILFFTGYVFCLAAVAALWFSDYDGMQSLAFYLTFSLGFGYSALVGFRLSKIDSK